MDTTTTQTPRTFTQGGYGFDFPGPMSEKTKARNEKTSAAQVRAFLSSRSWHGFGYLTKATDTAQGDTIATFAGAVLLRLDSVRTVKNAGAFYGRGSLVYFSGTDAKGRRWHGRSPGFGMFARLHRNIGPSPRKKPASRAALLRMLRDLYGVATGSARFLKDAQRIGDRNPYCNPAVRTVGKFLGDLS